MKRPPPPAGPRGLSGGSADRMVCGSSYGHEHEGREALARRI